VHAQGGRLKRAIPALGGQDRLRIAKFEFALPHDVSDYALRNRNAHQYPT
jgi:hypothetical protein